MSYDLTQSDADYDAAEPLPENLPAPPAGKYICVITSAQIKDNERSGYPELAIGARIVTGPHAGKMCWPRAGWDPDFIKYLRTLVERLGYTGKGSGIPDACGDFVGMHVEIACVQKEQFTNYYLNSRVDDPPPEEDSPPGADPDDEEIPF